MDRRDPAQVNAQASGRAPIALTIAGSDSGGGAGIQADLKTFAALGVFGVSAITAVTAQNTLGLRAIHAVPPDIVRAEIDAVLEDFDAAAIKIGMLANAEIVEAVADALVFPSPRPLSRVRERGGPLIPHRASKNARLSTGYGAGGSVFIVYDPVLAASSGDALAGAGFVEAIRAKLLSLVDCLTPNLPEAAALLGEPLAMSEPEMIAQGQTLLALGPRAVLMKGGHLDGDEAVDLLVTADGVRRFAAPWIASRNTHGTGCTLSSAIAAHVVLGLKPPDAVAAAKTFVRAAIERGAAARLGAGAGPLLQTPLFAQADPHTQDRGQ